MTSEPISIAVDAMGGDHAPETVMDGVGMALDKYGDSYRLLLVGDQHRVESELRRIGHFGDSRVEVVHAPEVVEMGEHPISAIRHKRQSSINVAMDLVKEGRAAGVYSAGSTGAAVGSAFFKLRMLEGIERPAIGAPMPSETGHFLIVDAGASVDCDPVNLVHFAVMGSIYAEKIWGITSPRVAIMSNGTEDGKGNRLTQGTFQLLQQVKGINFIGNCEGHDLYSGGVDVLVCDGFVGNVVLKCSEQMAKSIGHILKRFILSRLNWKVGGLLCKGAFGELKKLMDPSEYGGAPLLGVNGTVIIGHGSSDGRATCNGIRVAGENVRCGVNKLIAEQIGQLNFVK